MPLFCPCIQIVSAACRDIVQIPVVAISLLTHSPKGTPSGNKSPPTGCKHTVSGSFHSPRRGSFHLSLTVLLRYRSSNVFSLRQWSAFLPTELACSVVLLYPLCPCIPDSHRLRLTFPDHSALAFCEGGYSAFARHYSPNPIFSSGYLDVSVPQVPFR